MNCRKPSIQFAFATCSFVGEIGKTNIPTTKLAERNSEFITQAIVLGVIYFPTQSLTVPSYFDGLNVQNPGVRRNDFPP